MHTCGLTKQNYLWFSVSLWRLERKKMRSLHAVSGHRPLMATVASTDVHMPFAPFSLALLISFPSFRTVISIYEYFVLSIVTSFHVSRIIMRRWILVGCWASQLLTCDYMAQAYSVFLRCSSTSRSQRKWRESRRMKLKWQTAHVVVSVLDKLYYTFQVSESTA